MRKRKRRLVLNAPRTMCCGQEPGRCRCAQDRAEELARTIAGLAEMSRMRAEQGLTFNAPLTPTPGAGVPPDYQPGLRLACCGMPWGQCVCHQRVRDEIARQEEETWHFSRGLTPVGNHEVLTPPDAIQAAIEYNRAERAQRVERLTGNRSSTQESEGVVTNLGASSTGDVLEVPDSIQAAIEYGRAERALMDERCLTANLSGAIPPSPTEEGPMIYERDVLPLPRMPWE